MTSLALKDHIQKHISPTTGEQEIVSSFFESFHAQKKQNLLEEGQVCKQHFFVEKGILRMFYVNEKE
ncbi:MAG: hypothetical protein H7Y86_04945 [Rhizobacter sp.]|nr:hypothetical protein [Ferruginibacter sp.]